MVSLNDGPFFTMIALGSAGMADIPLMALVAALVPLVIGIILGNLDPKMKRLLNEAEPVIIVFLAVAVGCSMNFSQIISGGFGGIVLGLMTLIIGGIITVFFDRITGAPVLPVRPSPRWLATQSPRLLRLRRLTPASTMRL